MADPVPGDIFSMSYNGPSANEVITIQLRVVGIDYNPVVTCVVMSGPNAGATRILRLADLLSDYKKQETAPA